MNNLSGRTCQPCQKGAPLATQEEINNYLDQLPGWQIIVKEGVQQIEKVFNFKNFKQAIAFTNKLATLAEREQHHPAILTEWGKVTVTWWTHKVSGLHANDFIMAAKTDELT